MWYLVSVDHKGMVAHLTRNNCEGFKEVLYIQCSGWGVKRMGLLGVSVRNMKALTLKMKTVTLIGKGRLNLTCCVY